MTRAEIADGLDEADPTGDVLDAAAAELRKTCTWVASEVSSCWNTSCGNSFCVEMEDNHPFDFCGHCGGTIAEPKA